MQAGSVSTSGSDSSSFRQVVAENDGVVAAEEVEESVKAGNVKELKVCCYLSC